MRYLITAFFLHVFSLAIIAQKDSIVVENTYEYQIKEGKISQQKVVIEQKTFLEGRLYWHLFFNDTLFKVDEYKFFFYADSLLISEESYDENNVARSIKRYYYNPSKQIIEEKIYVNHDTKFELTSSIIYEYKKLDLIKKTVNNSNKKWTEQTVFSRLPEKQTVSTSYKKGVNPENMKSETIEIYFKEGLVVGKSISMAFFSGEEMLQKIEYEYKEGTTLIKKEITKNLAGQIMHISEFGYSKYAKKASCTEYSGDGKIIRYRHYESQKYLRSLGKQEMYKLPE